MAEKIKEKPKIQPKEPIQEKIKANPRKTEQSSFDKILEQNRMLQKTPQNTQASLHKTNPESQKVVRHQEQGRQGQDSQKDEKEKERTKEKAREERTTTTDVKQKVVAKGKKQGQDGQGGSKQGRGRGFGGAASRKAQMKLKKGTFTKAGQAAMESSKFASKLQQKMKTAHLSQEFIRNLVKKIVKFVKSGINKDGDKEVRLDLSDRIFRGLQLRVALKDGKVGVHFKASNSEVRELFTNSSDSIKEELKAKGIEVGDIKVT